MLPKLVIVAVITHVLLCGVSVSVCRSEYSVETSGQVQLVFWNGGFLPPVLCYKEIQMSAKMRVLPSGTSF